jgi:hypothetical protein
LCAILQRDPDSVSHPWQTFGATLKSARRPLKHWP